MAVILGTRGDDVQIGTADDDWILAPAGADIVDGLENFDTIAMVRLIGTNENDFDARPVADRRISVGAASQAGRHVRFYGLGNMIDRGRQVIRRHAYLIFASVVAMIPLGSVQAEMLGEDDAADANLPEAVSEAADEIPPGLSTDHTVAVFYVIPSDIDLEEEVLNRLVEATKDVQAWYQCATGGLTWELAFPEVVRVYFGDMSRQEYVDGGYYGPILAEMMSKGLPVFTPGVVTALWSRGAGFFAGANPGCDGECGVAMVGVEAFPEFNNPDWSGSTCPPGEGVSAFPCTPVGAFAHELGHALASLFHPSDVEETSGVASHSIMQTHWNYPTFAPDSERPRGFLSVERQALRSSPFLKKDVSLFQPHDCEVVNLPDNGEVPTAQFRTQTRRLTLSLTNNSKQGTLFYWTFGDGSVSNNGQKRLLHVYEEPGTYTVTLRASSDDSMIDLSARQIEVRQPAKHLTGLR